MVCFRNWCWLSLGIFLCWCCDDVVLLAAPCPSELIFPYYGSTHIPRAHACHEGMASYIAISRTLTRPLIAEPQNTRSLNLSSPVRCCNVVVSGEFITLDIFTGSAERQAVRIECHFLRRKLGSSATKPRRKCRLLCVLYSPSSTTWRSVASYLMRHRWKDLE